MRLVVVSNRLPISVDESEHSHPVVKNSSGGLVSALGPTLERHHGRWIGWAGSIDTPGNEVIELVSDRSKELGYGLDPVFLDRVDLEEFYQGYSNEIIWPLFHDLQSRCNFEPRYWDACARVLEKFKCVVARCTADDDLVWIHDYHLMGLGERLRRDGVGQRLGFFLHIPFPEPDIFSKLPWRSEVIESLFAYDTVGFQTAHDLDNFKACIRRHVETARVRRHGTVLECEWRGRRVRLGAFPIGIDAARIEHAAASPEVTNRCREIRDHFAGLEIILGIDRLDYTKGIPDRLRAFQLALELHPELRRRVALLQVVVPSREDVPEYQELKARVERAVAQINGEFTEPGWTPVHYIYRSLQWYELLAYYRSADVALVTPLKDGMNLVCKEYCSSQVEGDGVLILSEFAGAATQLKQHAILVNPYDVTRVADAIHFAVGLTREQRRPSMRQLRSIIRRHDVHWWADRFLCEAGFGSETASSEEDASVKLQSPLSDMG